MSPIKKKKLRSEASISDFTLPSSALTYSLQPSELTYCQPKYWSPLANHNPAIFSVPRGTEKLNKSTEADKKPW